MGGSPATPDYKAAAEAEAAGSHPDIVTPWGKMDWTEGADSRGNQTWSGKVSLTPEQQQALNSQQQIQQNQSGLAQTLQGQATQSLSSPMDWSGLGTMGTGDAARDQAINAAYGQASSRLDPQWSQKENSTVAALRAQGLDPGDRAYDNQLANLGRDRNDAYTSAMNSAIGQGTSAGQAVFNQNLQGRQQTISEMLQQRNQPLNEMQAVLGGQQVSMPTFPGAGTQGAAYNQAASSQYGANVNNYNAGQAQLQGLLGGAAGLFRF